MPLGPNRGFSLVELMIALTVGLILTAGMLGLFVTSKRVYNEAELIASLQENGRFALDYLVTDLRHAGFFGQSRHFDLVPADDLGTVVDDCTGPAATFALGSPLWGSSATTANALGCIDDALVVDGIPSDLLAVKSVARAPYRDSDNSGVIGDTEDYDGDGTIDANDALKVGRVYVVSNAQQGELIALRDADAVSGVPSVAGDGDYPYGAFWEYRAAVYYIRDPDPNDSEPPILARKALANDAGAIRLVTEDLVPGVEALRVLYGFDSDSDGAADTYLPADQVSAWQDVLSAQVHLLVRTTEPAPRYRDTKTYRLGDLTVTATKSDTASQGAEHRQFRRLVVSTTVELRNAQLAAQLRDP